MMEINKSAVGHALAHRVGVEVEVEEDACEGDQANNDEGEGRAARDITPGQVGVPLNLDFIILH